MRLHWIGSILFSLSTLALNTAHSASGNTLVWKDNQGLRNQQACTAISDSALPSNLRNLAENVIEIQDLPGSTEIGEAHFPLVGSFWQAVQQNGGLAAIQCLGDESSQSYLLFDVFLPNQMLPVARVAVADENASIFQNIRVHTVEEAEQLLAQQGSSDTDAGVKAQSMAADVASVEGSLDYVVCTPGTSLNVRDQSLTTVLFSVKAYEAVKPVQSFGTDRVQKTINGVTYYFIKVQFPNRASTANIGWTADKYIKLRSQCAGAPQTAVTAPQGSTQTWTFPLLKRTTASYKTGMRAFGSSRSGGARLHAAADLYRIDGEAALSVTSGKVIRDRYYFYQGTYAIEVQHTGGKVVRYGEIKGKSAPYVAFGKAVKTGQTIGYIGTVNSGCCRPMLHFEMYAGTATGALTQTGINKYNRRRDIMNPTTSLSTWEKAKFGVTY